MRFQKKTAFLLAVVMLLTLCSCGTVAEPTAADTAPAPAAESAAEPFVTAEPTAEKAESLDFDAAYKTYAPDTVVFYVGEAGVTWQELFYQIAFHAAYLASMEGKPITSWSDTSSVYLDAQGNPVPYGSIVMQNATSTLLQYHIMNNRFQKEGLTLSEEAMAAVELVRQNTIDQSFGGDEGAFLAYLDRLYCTEEIWNWFNQVDAMYNYDGFEHFSGEMGSLLPDEDVMAYAAGDENGAWTEYVQLKLICLYDEAEKTTDAGEEEASGEASEETSAEPAEENVDAEELLVQILTAEDPEATFDELYALYNEESIMDNYPDGRCVFQGDIHDTVYRTALSMEIGEYKLVSLEGTDVIILKKPLDPDGGVIYDEATDTMHTLRSFAAWQAYAEMTGGENGWIATDTSGAKWAEGFETFSLDMVF